MMVSIRPHMLLVMCAILNEHILTIVGAVMVWEPQDHVVGNWDLIVHGISDRMLFPIRQEPVLSPPIGADPPLVQTISGSLPRQAQHPSKKTTTTSKRKLIMNCHLSLFPNGTFTLEPTCEPRNLGPESIDSPSSVSCLSPQKQQQQQQQRLFLHGRWKVERNPYCVTDRFYDRLILEGYPRIQKLIPMSPQQFEEQHQQQQSTRETATTATTRTTTCVPETLPHHPQEIVIQKVAIHLSCRIWGRYYRQRRYLQARRQRQGQQQQQQQRPSLAHMTHGSLLWHVEHDPNPQQANSMDNSNNNKQRWWRRKRIAATFTGKLKPALSSPTTMGREDADFNSQDDQELFGY